MLTKFTGHNGNESGRLCADPKNFFTLSELSVQVTFGAVSVRPMSLLGGS